MYISREELCLNEQQLFLVVHGALVGAAYSAKFFLAEHNYLAFSRLQVYKYTILNIQTLVFLVNVMKYLYMVVV